MTNPARRAQRGIDCIDLVLKRADRGSGTGSLIFVIGDFNQDPTRLEVVLGRLCQRHTVIMLPVDDPADWSLPDMGRVVFHGMSGETMEIDTSKASGRQAYEEAWKNRRKTLRNIAGRLGITVISLRTDTDVHRSLMEGLKRRAASQGVR